jgi:riboflavin kinase / FMN adenylyltransferase
VKIIEWKEFVKFGVGSSDTAGITVGVFDGIHIGHRKLIGNIISFASENEEAVSVVFTFRTNPSAFFHPGGFLGNLSTLSQKMDSFAEMGLGYVVLIDFSAEFSKLTGSDFLHIIEERLQAGYLCIGKNFHCGRNNDTNSLRVKNLLENNRTIVDIVEQVVYKNRPVSSTRIREEVMYGNINAVNDMLGRPYEISLQSGNIIEQIIPSDGLYEVVLEKKKNGENKTKRNSSRLEIINKELQLSAEINNINKIETIQFIDKISDEI